MPRLIDDMVDVLAEMRHFITDLEYLSTYSILSLLKRYDDMKEQEVEEAQLTEENLIDAGANPDSSIDEPSDYTALSPEYDGIIANSDLPENFDEWGQGYGRCPICGMPWSIVRPGKGQPACECADKAEHHMTDEEWRALNNQMLENWEELLRYPDENEHAKKE